MERSKLNTFPEKCCEIMEHRRNNGEIWYRDMVGQFFMGNYEVRYCPHCGEKIEIDTD